MEVFYNSTRHLIKQKLCMMENSLKRILKSSIESHSHFIEFNVSLNIRKLYNEKNMRHLN
ncbi:hypothetical protein BpHYR1_024613 [Brachionus plicatilis]|uniref:Uncharacterized protein n=1 Tax=Brachionus plicatilis TaxID=10195 RepID=A0A3M7SQN8_BRAPC|nr:hypothetical protein BpHYR1_024613 [Brachionus plicatilis]